MVLGSCDGNFLTKFKTYGGPEVTKIVVDKASRKMRLFHDDEVLKEYSIDLGFAPKGHKLKEGDGRTPEGSYLIDRRNYNSSYHLSLGISYPNKQDVSRARAAGDVPGHDIFIHGGPKRFADRFKFDWTAGCISVTNSEIEEIYAMVRTGTPVLINP